MIFRIIIGLYFLLVGLSGIGVYSAPGQLIGILALVGGIALLAGL